MNDEKLKKVCKDFSLLNEEQQEYILGIMQALVFAKNSSSNPEQEQEQESLKQKQSSIRHKKS